MLETGKHSRAEGACCRRIAAALIGGAITMLAASAYGQSHVGINVDSSTEYQTWFGFGATHEILVYGGAGDVLSASQRQRAVNALYSEIKITTGQIPVTFEAPASLTFETYYAGQANDNNDPEDLASSGFFTGLGDAFKDNNVGVAGGSVFDLYPDVKINTKWASKWLADISGTDYGQYVDECAEQALAGVEYFEKTYGMAPPYAMLFNEPTTGNGELIGGTPQMITDIVRQTGKRLEAAGYGSVGLVVPAEETEERSLEVATAILNDNDARHYVGAIAFHTYPYGSQYSYVPNILAGPGMGNPDPARIDVRHRLKDLGAKYGVPIWMTEVSNGYRTADGVDVTDFRTARGRAIHIHDELLYAGVSAYFGMNSMWDTKSESFHFGGDGSSMMVSAHDTLVLVEQATDTVTISGMGRAIGHYARFISKGAKRVDAASDDALVLVSAFTQQDRLVFVVVNNRTDSAELDFSVMGRELPASISGEQSTAGNYWKALTPFAPDDSGTFTTVVPAESITTLVASSSPINNPGTGGSSSQGGASSSRGGASPSEGGASSSEGGASSSLGGASSPGGGAGSSGSGTSSGSGCGCSMPRALDSRLGLVLAVGLACSWLSRRRSSAGRRRS
jgi:hypothetical protein